MKYVVWFLVLIFIYLILKLPGTTAATVASAPAKIASHLLDPTKPLVPDPPGYAVASKASSGGSVSSTATLWETILGALGQGVRNVLP